MPVQCPTCGSTIADMEKIEADRRERLMKNLLSIRQSLYGGSSKFIHIDLGAFGPIADAIMRDFKEQIDDIEIQVQEILNNMGDAASPAKDKAKQLLSKIRASRPPSPKPDLKIV